MSQVLGAWWNQLTTMAFSVPVCTASAGWYQYMNFQITASATDEIAIGRKISDLTRLS